jgi:hypothetical protein
VKNGVFSNDINMYQNAGHQIYYDASGNNTDLKIGTGSSGVLLPLGAPDFAPRLDGVNVLGKWVPQRQWKALYICHDSDNSSGIIFNNDVWLRHITSGTLNLRGFLDTDVGLKKSGLQVVGARQSAISDITVTGTAQDSNARTKINAVLAALRAHGLIAT